MRILKWAVLLILVLVLLAGGAAGAYFYGLHPKLRPPPQLTAPSTPEAIAHGRYLATHVAMCVSCHSETDLGAPGDPVKPGRLGSGKVFPELPDFPGRIRTPNLTPDRTHGLGAWTDGEIVRAIREGVSRDGRALFPMMPYRTYARTLSDDDALAIVAYLRTLPAIDHDPGPMEVKFPVSMFIRTAPRPLGASPPPAPGGRDRLARGRWLLEIMSCADCHTPSRQGEPVEGKAFAGGGAFGPWPGGGMLYASNITGDRATGIGSYTDEDLLRVFNEGKNKAGQSLYLMPWSEMTGLTDDDKAALIAALREIPPVSNLVPASTIKR